MKLPPMPPNVGCAYLVAHLDLRSMQVVRVGLYGEERPTQDLHSERLLTIKRVEGKHDHAEARRLILEDLAAVNPYNGESWHEWALPLIDEHTRREVLALR